MQPSPSEAQATVDSGDVRLFVRRLGRPSGRTPLLLLHGANYYDSADWVDVGTRLGQHRDVIAFDTRGFGHSGWSTRKDYGLAAILADIRAVLAHAGWQRVVLVGHSRGGAQSLMAAARMPDLVAGLALVDYNPCRGFGPPGGVIPPSARELTIFPSVEAALAATTRYRTDPLTPAMRARALEFLQPVEGGLQLARRDPSVLDGMVDTGAAIGLRSGEEELAATECPVLVLHASRSSAFSPDELARLHTTGRVRLQEVDSGHDVPGEAPDALLTGLNAWLGDTVQPGPG